MSDSSAPMAHDGDTTDSTWGLDEALRALRSDLQAVAGDKVDFRFPVESATFELTVVAVKDKSGRVSFKVPVIGADGELARHHEVHSRITLVLGAPVHSESGAQVKVNRLSGTPKR